MLRILVVLAAVAVVGCGSPGPAGPAGPMGDMGSMGTMGHPGMNGMNGKSVTVAAEAPGVACPNGGVKLTSVTGSSYVCNGSAGSSGDGGVSGTPAAIANTLVQRDADAGFAASSIDLTSGLTIGG